jgi:hypothetical protein
VEAGNQATLNNPQVATPATVITKTGLGTMLVKLPRTINLLVNEGKVVWYDSTIQNFPPDSSVTVNGPNALLELEQPPPVTQAFPVPPPHLANLTVASGTLSWIYFGRATTANFTLHAQASLRGSVSTGSLFSSFGVTGSVALGGASLSYSGSALNFPVGQSITLIENDGSDAVQGTFADLPEGGSVAIGGTLFQISYVGGTGNDVVLTAQGTPPSDFQPSITAFSLSAPANNGSRTFSATGKGAPGFSYGLQTSFDLIQWQNLLSPQAPDANGVLNFSYPAPPPPLGQNEQFWRIKRF